jgi:hypothetical protein
MRQSELISIHAIGSLMIAGDQVIPGAADSAGCYHGHHGLNIDPLVRHTKEETAKARPTRSDL